MRKFVVKKNYRMSYKKQGYIFFACQNYDAMSARMKKKIDRLCEEIGKDDSKALFEAMTGDRSVERIAARHFVNRHKLYKMIHEFYRKW